jgi:hypothetical protein
MAFDTGWNLPATVAVTFDPPVTVVGVRDASAFREAYADFFRGELATSLDGPLDEDAINRVANRLGMCSWRPSFSRFGRPADATELADLTRVVQAYARSGGAMRSTRRPGYWRHDEHRSSAMDVATECEECRVRELNVSSDAATLYRLCEKHHRETYRKYVDATRCHPVSPDPDEPFDLGDRLDDEELPTDAARRLAEIAAYDPHVVRPVRESLLRAFEAQRGAALVSLDFLRPVTAALTHLGTIDGLVRERFIRSLTDEDDAIRQASAAAIGSLAWERPDALLSVDEGSLGGSADETRPPVVRRLGGMLAEDDPDSREQALSALREFARSHPHHVEPYADTVAMQLTDEHARIRFFAAVTLSNLALASADIGARYAGELAALADEPGALAAAGAIALGALDHAGIPVDQSSEALLAAVRTYADPSRQPRRVVRESMYVLGRLGGPGELEHVDWVDDCARDEALKHACETARDRLFVT